MAPSVMSEKETSILGQKSLKACAAELGVERRWAWAGQRVVVEDRSCPPGLVPDLDPVPAQAAAVQQLLPAVASSMPLAERLDSGELVGQARRSDACLTGTS